MRFKIHRGTREIGGSCVEIRTESTRILLDIGMPLVGKDGAAFDFTRHEGAAIDELVQDEILPDLSGCYRNTDLQMNGILVSHAHLDHYGFCTFLHPEMQYYLGQATHRILELNSIFTPQTVTIKNAAYFEPSKPFLIGDIEITPFLMDHSAFDACAFLIKADGKSIFYSGDFRGHGRKGKAFKRFLSRPQRRRLPADGRHPD